MAFTNMRFDTLTTVKGNVIQCSAFMIVGHALTFRYTLLMFRKLCEQCLSNAATLKTAKLSVFVTFTVSNHLCTNVTTTLFTTIEFYKAAYIINPANCLF